MKNTKILSLAVLMSVMMLVLAACTNSSNEDTKSKETEGTNETKEVDETNKTKDTSETQKNEDSTVEITDLHGKVTVPVNPKKVVALDSRSFETLRNWGVKLEAVPKAVMPADSPYVSDDSVKDIGNHREPNLEVLASVEPDVVIVGQRFASHYDEIKKIVPNAAVVDLNFDVSEEASEPGKNLVEGLKHSTISLGKIFDKNKEAEELVSKLDESIKGAKDAYNGTDKIMSVVVSGGNIGFAAPGSGRVWGPMYEIFGWVPALEVQNASSDHKGDDISVEAIAQSDPDWIFVLDRDAAVSSVTDKVPAQDVIDNAPALKNTRAIKEEKIVYAPEDTYSNESIETFIELFDKLRDALSK